MTAAPRARSPRRKAREWEMYAVDGWLIRPSEAHKWPDFAWQKITVREVLPVAKPAAAKPKAKRQRQRKGAK